MAKIMISLPDALLQDADRMAKRQRRTRSELFREALRMMIEGGQREKPAWGEVARAVHERVQGHWTGRWDSTSVIREDRDGERGRPRR